MAGVGGSSQTLTNDLVYEWAIWDIHNWKIVGGEIVSLLNWKLAKWSSTFCVSNKTKTETENKTKQKGKMWLCKWSHRVSW